MKADERDGTTDDRGPAARTRRAGAPSTAEQPDGPPDASVPKPAGGSGSSASKPTGGSGASATKPAGRPSGSSAPLPAGSPCASATKPAGSSGALVPKPTGYASATKPTGSSCASSPDWARGALDEVLGRVGVTLDEVGDRFPLFADRDTGRWTTSRRGSWTGGFWAGLLWLRARQTGEERDRAAASACTARLAPWVEADTATRGLILWYGTALADRDPGASALRARAARACLEAYEPRLGLVPWGSALGGPRLLARADGVPGMVPLLATESAGAAASHLRSHLDLCVLGAEGLRPAWHRENETDGWRPHDEPPPGWTRGRAWLLLAVADALLAAGDDPGGSRTGGHTAGAETVTDGARTDDQGRPSAGGGTARAGAPHGFDRADERLVTALEFLRPRDGEPLVPVADEGVPGGPVDTSAAAITAVALLKLSRLPDARAARHAERAVAVLSRLTTAHMSRGRLLDGCDDVRRGTAVRHELVWGDFFLALGLAALAGGGRGGPVDLTTV